VRSHSAREAYQLPSWCGARGLGIEAVIEVGDPQTPYWRDTSRVVGIADMPILTRMGADSRCEFPEGDRPRDGGSFSGAPSEV
jgi:hypothetical protein